MDIKKLKVVKKKKSNNLWKIADTIFEGKV